MIGAIVYQLTRNLSEEEVKKSGFDTYFVDHTTGIYPVSYTHLDVYKRQLGVSELSKASPISRPMPMQSALTASMSNS